MANRITIGLVALWVAALVSMYVLTETHTARVASGTVLCAPSRRCAPVESDVVVRYTLPIFGDRSRASVVVVGDRLHERREGLMNISDLLPHDLESTSQEFAGPP